MIEKVDEICVFCDKPVINHSNFELKKCLSKHLEVQKILQNAIGDGSSILNIT
tara:strand:- start:31 stop:189 length:159 start_codon:yes stop_codon:yes gene_type:complete